MGRWQRKALTEGPMTRRRCPSTTRFARGPPPHRCATGGSATTVPHPPRPPHLAASRPDDYSRSMSDAKIFISANELLADSLRLGMQVVDSGFKPPPLVGIRRGGAPVGIAGRSAEHTSEPKSTKR